MGLTTDAQARWEAKSRKACAVTATISNVAKSLQWGTFMGPPPSRTMAEAGKAEMILGLFSTTRDFDVNGGGTATDEAGDTALHKAAQNGHLIVCHILWKVRLLPASPRSISTLIQHLMCGWTHVPAWSNQRSPQQGGKHTNAGGHAKSSPVVCRLPQRPREVCLLPLPLPKYVNID
eukprot:2649783-Rhodomonas_salina.1